MTTLVDVTETPRLHLWARLDAHLLDDADEPRAGLDAYVLACPGCERVFKVLDQRPLPFPCARTESDAGSSSDGITDGITIEGEVHCPHGCGAVFSVYQGQVEWHNAPGHWAA